MARKDSQKPSRWRGIGDITGIVLMALAVLLLVAMMSFDRNDIAVNRAPANDTVYNWIGPRAPTWSTGCSWRLGRALSPFRSSC